MPSPVSSPHPWQSPPEDLRLPPGEIHIWRVRLTPPPAEVARLRGVLSEEELRRAGRFRFPEHQRHFTVARGTLRMLLGRYLQEAPGKLRFAYNPYGKPFLHGASPADHLRFNLSHSGDLALYAFARDREVGIDVEWTRRAVGDVEDIAGRFFSSHEAGALLALPEPDRRRCFFDCWTRKEAYIKARGKGLSIPLDRFRVSLVPPPAKCPVPPHDDAAGTSPWMMHAFAPERDYVAALVVEGEMHSVRYWR